MRGSASSYRLTSPLRKNRKWRQNDREDGDESLDLIQGDSDRGDIPESDTQYLAVGEFVCRAHLRIILRRMDIAEGFPGRVKGKKEGRRGQKKAARSDE